MSRLTVVKRALQSATGYGRHLRAVCPFCNMQGHGTKKKNLTFDKGTGKFFCFRCHNSGKMEGYAIQEEYLALHQELVEFSPPHDWAELYGFSCSHTARAKRYALEKRKLQAIHIAEAKLGTVVTNSRPPRGEQDWRNRLIVPITSSTNEWLGYVGRDITGKSDLPYMYVRGMQRGKILYNQKALYEDTEEPIFVVEGTLDAVYLWPNAVALLGMWTDDQIDLLLETKRPIVVLLDGDAWKKGEALSDILKMYGARSGWIRLGPKLDPDDMERSWIKEEGYRCIASV